MDPQSSQDVPVADATPQDVPPVQPEPNQPDAPTEPQPQQQPQAPEQPAATPEAVDTLEDDIEYPDFSIPDAQPIDFSKIPVGEDNLIDPNALAQTINQSIAAAEERATQRAQRAFAEQRSEERAWEKAYEKYPELKGNREFKDMVQSMRIGEATNLLSRARTQEEVQNAKLPTPAQMAERLFKYMGNAKQEGMKQATQNTVIQQSAHIETAGRRTDDAAEAKTRAFQNINNPNKDVARQARADYLKRMVFGDA